jgi:hypothetical protein
MKTSVAELKKYIEEILKKILAISGVLAFFYLLIVLFEKSERSRR